ncbi:MAG TPA: hypothetical protein VMU94_16315 [Streptosporangiaceae bacterium]|nr:hypothetical protein [Streptosporangiaceae bacterium]
MGRRRALLRRRGQRGRGDRRPVDRSRLLRVAEQNQAAKLAGPEHGHDVEEAEALSEELGSAT